jgi:hypothetical protein
MTSHIQSGLLRTAACLLAILPAIRIEFWSETEQAARKQGLMFEMQSTE